jgi:phosphoribosylanthranilate isomerase
MIVQVFAIKTIHELQMCIEAGLDRWGLEVGKKGTMPSERSFEQARGLFAATPAGYPKMALTIETNIDEIIEIARETKPDLLHLCGELRQLPPEGISEIRKRIPGVGIIQAIPITGPESVDLALAYEQVADVLFLDSYDPNEVGIGIVGKTHDWKISRKIVEMTRKPCVLAGGLSPENVAEAIRAVHPWGVDSNTHTCVPGTWNKDFRRMQQFAQAAHAADEDRKT